MAQIVNIKLQLKKFVHVRVPRNKDLFKTYHPTDTSKDYFPDSESPVNSLDGLNKNQQLQYARNHAVEQEVNRRKSKKKSDKSEPPAPSEQEVENA